MYVKHVKCYKNKDNNCTTTISHGNWSHSTVNSSQMSCNIWTAFSWSHECFSHYFVVSFFWIWQNCKSELTMPSEHLIHTRIHRIHILFSADKVCSFSKSYTLSNTKLFIIIVFGIYFHCIIRLSFRKIRFYLQNAPRWKTKRTQANILPYYAFRLATLFTWPRSFAFFSFDWFPTISLTDLFKTHEKGGRK